MGFGCGHLFEFEGEGVGVYSRLGAYSNKYGIQAMEYTF